MTLGTCQDCEKLLISSHLHAAACENKYGNRERRRRSHFRFAMLISNIYSFHESLRFCNPEPPNERVCVACVNIERTACRTPGAYTGWETGKSWSRSAALTHLIHQWADSDATILITGSYAGEVVIPWGDSSVNTIDSILKRAKVFAKGGTS